MIASHQVWRLCFLIIFQITEIKAAQYESEKTFRAKIQDLSKKNSEYSEILSVSITVIRL